MTRPLEVQTPLISCHAIPGATYNGKWLPTFAAALSPITFAGGNLFDVSAWDAWALYVNLFPAAASASPSLSLSWMNNTSLVIPNQFIATQTIVLPNVDQEGPVLILGRVLAPLLAIQLTAILSSAGMNNLDFFVSNRTRLYDAPYTPAPLGSILATLPQQTVANNVKATTSIPYYQGPARLGGFFAAAASTAAGATARVADDQGPNVQVLAAVNPDQPTTDLWIPNTNVLTGATQWSLQLFNESGAAVAMEATLVAA